MAILSLIGTIPEIPINECIFEEINPDTPFSRWEETAVESLSRFEREKGLIIYLSECTPVLDAALNAAKILGFKSVVLVRYAIENKKFIAKNVILVSIDSNEKKGGRTHEGQMRVLHSSASNKNRYHLARWKNAYHKHRTVADHQGRRT